MQRQLGVSRGDIQRIMQHYGVDEVTAARALSLASASELLPKRGTGLVTGEDNGVTLPWWLFSGLLSFGFGVLLGPAIFASTKAGSERLAEMARKKIG